MSEVKLHGNSRLTAGQVRDLRKSYEDGCPCCGKPYTMKELGTAYGISSVAVYKIIHGKSYSTVP